MGIVRPKAALAASRRRFSPPALGLAAHADVTLDEVVVGSEVVVRERPIFAGAVEGSPLQVLLAHSIALPAPYVGAAPDEPRTPLPAEGLVGGRGVRLVEVVHEPMSVVLRTGVAV